MKMTTTIKMERGRKMMRIEGTLMMKKVIATQVMEM